MSVCLFFLSFFRKQKWPAAIFKVFLWNFLTFLFLKLWKTFFKFAVFEFFSKKSSQNTTQKSPAGSFKS